MRQQKFSTATAKIVSNAGGGSWAQVVTFDNLWVVMALGSNDGKLGRELLNFLESWAASLKGKKQNLASVSDLLEGLKEKVPSEKNLSLALALLVDDVLYLAVSLGAAYLKRGEKLEKIAEGGETASGFLKDGDLLILGSDQFFETLGDQKFAENLDHFSPEEIAERLAPQISSLEENGGCAALIVGFKQEEELPGELSEEVEEEEVLTYGTAPIIIPKKNLVARLVERVKGFKIHRGGLPLSLPSSGGGEGKEKKTLVTVAFVLILLLSLSVFFGLNKTRESETVKKFNSLYQEANSQYEEGRGLIGLNDALARSRLFGVEEKIKTIEKSLRLSKKQEQNLEGLKKEVQEQMVILSRVYKLGNLPLFWETSLVKPNSVVEKMAIQDNQLALLDIKNHFVYLLSAKTKAVNTLGGNDLKAEPKLLGFGSENAYLLSSEGIRRLGIQNKKSQLVISYDEAWGDSVALNAFGGNLYLLVRKNGLDLGGQIWKYNGTDSGFSQRKSYFPSDIKPDLSKALDMAIDGSVWVLNPEGISKFTSGRPDNFVISGLEGDFGNPEAIFTDDSSRNLYLLDPSNKRVLVLGKDGVYQAQYEAEELSQARDLVVSETEKKIFVNAGSKIYYIEIK